MSKFLFFVPAKFNSSRIKKKNLVCINNKPLIEYTLDLLRENVCRNDVYISSESLILKKYSVKYGFNFHKRPLRLATKFATTESALENLLNGISSLSQYDWVITLQPTSPMRDGNSFFKFLNLAKNNKKKKSIISMHPSYEDIWIRDSKENYKRVFKKNHRNQLLRNPIYIENGAYYGTNINYFRKHLKIISSNPLVHLTSTKEGFDINNEYDIEVANLLLNQTKLKK